ncbi:MAG: dihydrolipoyl dehydrogenase [Rhodobacteraceae bacterium]|nr:dihydrolipoyl dehydrogenase [Paracoccaceae bacterium]MCY4248867.1 dihydrolipoyl dehydrogenase [Paracoccaceae bacterium]
MSNTKFDMVVIGTGPGGYVSAIRGSQLGLNVAVVEREDLGGICLNWGCIPTKSILRSAEIFHLMNRATEFGLKAENIDFDLNQIIKRSRSIAKQLSGGVTHLLRKNKVTVFNGEAKFKSKNKLLISESGKETSIAAKNIVIATGARARQVPGLEVDGKNIWAYREALQPPRVPKKLLVVGSGAIGIEFASFFNSIGSETTVVEMLDTILPVEDREISAFAKKQFQKHGMTIIEGAQVKGTKKVKDGIEVTIKDTKGESRIIFDTIISAVGIVGNVENLNLEGIGVKVDRTHIVVDELCQTGVPNVYAIGDVAGPPWLAHKASHEGVMVAEIIGGGKPHPIVPNSIPGCTYSMPQIASVGLTEEKCKEMGIKYKVGRFPFIGNGKAIALGESEGLIKTIFDEKSGEFLGAHMVGSEVTELIQGYVVGRQLETTESELMDTVFPHPTLSEMMHESVLNAYDRSIHI